MIGDISKLETSSSINSKHNNNNNNNKSNNQSRLKSNLKLKANLNYKNNHLDPSSHQLKHIKNINHSKHYNSSMTKSYNFNINIALDYTCHRLNGNDKSINFCGKCNSCQIVNQLNNLKQWFDRASHITIKRLLVGLVSRINNVKISKYLNDLLKPLTDSKDFIYARNKFLPSCEEDQLKATNNRCLDNEYVNKQLNDVWNWYSSSSNFVKINFMLSLLNKCEQAIVFMTILKLRSVLETHNPYSESVQSSLEDRNDSEYEIVCEAYDEEEEEDEEVKNILKKDEEYNPRDSKYVDFIRLLPVHISKSILSSLNKKSLYNCLFVCKYWCNLIKEVRKEGNLHKALLDDMMLLKGTSSKGINPRYANNVDVKVPNLVPGSYDIVRNPEEPELKVSKSEANWTNSFSGFSTRNVIMEERNVFCGPYNVLLLKDKKDPHRVIHFNGKNIAAMGSFDKKIRLIDLKSTTEKNSTIQGHAGSIKCIYVCETKNIVITGSFDTSIRIWSIKEKDFGKCLKIFQGHQQTITCLAMFENHDRVISGSADKTCKVWNLGKKKCWRTFKHLYQITSVAIGEEICITGGQTGKIKVFHLQSGKLIKTISAHQGPVNSIKFDRWHILTCSNDYYALVFSTQGRHKKCIVAMRHQKEVLCIEFQYLRAITGAADGKLRIWNILTGDCLRVLRGNSQCDPILSMSIVDNRILLNTENNVIFMEFEIVIYDYASSSSNPEEQNDANFDQDPKRSSILKKPRSYSLIRASRSELVGTPNVKIFNDERKSVLDHSARPISGKNLKDAHIVHTVSSKPLNISRNSIGNISEFGLQKRQSIVQSINATIVSQTSLSVLSNRATALSHTNPNNPFSKKNDSNKANLEKELESFRNRTTDLNETKQYLRDQLKEIKQSQQGTPSDDASELSSPSNFNSMETKSCIETRLLNRNDIMKYNDDSELNFSRPTSSPSRYDTKTKVRLQPNEINRIKELEEKFNQILNNQNQIQEPGDIKVQSSKKAQAAQKLNEIINSQYEHLDKVKQVTKNHTTLVSKVFETHERDLKTSSKMHPMNLKSKIPNPKIVNPVLVKQQQNNHQQIQQHIIKKTITSKLENEFFNTNRSKSAYVAAQQTNELIPILFRPKSNLPKRKPKTEYVPDPYETSKLAANDKLNLMTFKQVDQIVDHLNGFTSPEKAKELEQAEFYKKIWTLKSTGKYHGSLLAKPKTVAPEIRE